MLSLSFLAFSIIFVWSNLTFFDGKLHVVFCDVGQGDGVFIRTPSGADIVIDGGPNNGKFEKCLESHMPFYDKKLELVFATHPDADHIGGLPKLLSKYSVDSYNTINLEKDTGVFALLERVIEERGIKKSLIGGGDNFITTDGVAIKTFWPDKGLLATAKENTKNIDVNSYSLVQTITLGEFSYLATADVDETHLDSLLPGFSGIDIFKLPHHGSHTGIDDRTFELLKPLLSIISVGKNSKYGHPHPEVVAELKEHDLKYFRTDQGGEVEVVSDGKTFEVRRP